MSKVTLVLFIFLGLIILCIIFILIRELVCWYNKVNERIKLQERTNYLLERVYEQLGGKFVDEEKKKE
jgi:hypothetical protein